MSIIPQDPFLFNDTVSMNLDPKQEFTSFEILNVLEKCHLKNFVKDLGKHQYASKFSNDIFLIGETELMFFNILIL